MSNLVAPAGSLLSTPTTSSSSTIHQPSLASPSQTPTGGPPHFAIIIVLALLTAVLVRMFWKVVLTLVIVLGLTLIFIGVFASVSMMTPHG